MSEYDGVDSARTEHSIEWTASLTYGGHLWAESCPYCGNDRVFNITYEETAQVVTSGVESEDNPDQARYEPDDRGASRLQRVTCNSCYAVLLDRQTPQNEGPRP